MPRQPAEAKSMKPDESSKIRVLVVDDSALMRRQISMILSSDPGFTVVDQASDGIEALEKIQSIKPDVITLDVEMPRMNGITCLKHIMVKYSVPTVMISSLTKEGAKTSFDALRYGAIDVIAKPSRREDADLDSQKADIIAKVRRAASIRTGRFKYLRIPQPTVTSRQDRGTPDRNTTFITIGAGTGGYYGLLRTIPVVPEGFNDTIIAVIHASAGNVEPFAAYLHSHSNIPVQHGKDGVSVRKGSCYLCSAEHTLVMIENGTGNLMFSDLAGNSHSSRGSINVMMQSVAEYAGSRSIGVVMTGSGQDGAEGLLHINKAGGKCIVQDINNCIDPSMPLAALEQAVVEQLVPDYLLAEHLLNATK
jgi:two-component system chemotaxis response regulator CheB